MPYLKQIASAINSELKSNVFTDKRFASADFNSLAYSIVVDNREDRNLIAPCVAGSDGEYTAMMFDDTKAFVVYHKALSKSYVQIADREAFGRSAGKNVRCTAQMQMIILATRSIIKILPDDLETLVVMNFPNGNETIFSAVSASITGIATKTVSSDTDFLRLWATEFRGYEFQVNPDRAILAVNYTIESNFKTKCFSLCDCQGEN
jgi:hypothetical protein